jgi:hypothetical protein
MLSKFNGRRPENHKSCHSDQIFRITASAPDRNPDRYFRNRFEGTTLPRLGSRVRIPSPAPNKSPENQHQRCVCGGDVSASICLNEPRTVPNSLAGLGKRRAKRSRKVPERSPLQKRRAGSAATERGSKSKSRSHCKTTLRQGPAQAPRHPSLYVYDGQICLGRIEQDGDHGFAAFTTADCPLGSFGDLKAAADAVGAANGGTL